MSIIVKQFLPLILLENLQNYFLFVWPKLINKKLLKYYFTIVRHSINRYFKGNLASTKVINDHLFVEMKGMIMNKFGDAFIRDSGWLHCSTIGIQ